MPVDDEDVKNSMEPQYQKIKRSLDTGQNVLHYLTDSINLHEISMSCTELKNQHHVLSTQLIMLILQKKNLCQTHLEIISDVQTNLDDAVKICMKCRDNLNSTSEGLIFSSLKILYYFRRRKIIGNILKLLCNIKKVVRWDSYLILHHVKLEKSCS